MLDATTYLLLSVFVSFTTATVILGLVTYLEARERFEEDTDP